MGVVGLCSVQGGERGGSMILFLCIAHFVFVAYLSVLLLYSCSRFFFFLVHIFVFVLLGLLVFVIFSLPRLSHVCLLPSSSL